MKMIQSDIKILDSLLALNLDISIWSARKKMTPEDFGGVELPPEDLASLGSKRVADPEKLKIFGTLKSRAFSFLDRHGVRFLSGWAIPEEKADMILDELVKIRGDFLAAKATFLAEYDISIDEWLSRHEEWSGIIRDSLASPDYVRSRLDFRWQLYKVASMPLASPDAGLEEEVKSLGNTLFGEISRSATEIWRKVYEGKSEVTHKALSPLRTLREKLNGLSFVEPHVAPVVEMLDASLKRMPPKGNISGTDLLLLQGLVNLLRDSDALVLHAQKLIEGATSGSVLESLVLKAEPFEAQDKPPILTSAPLKKQPAPVASYGLW